MIAFLFFLINAIEAFLLAVYLLLVGSSPDEQIFLGLSTLRLITITVIIILGVGFTILSVRTFRKKGKVQLVFNKILQNESLLWISITGSFIFAGLFTFLLTREAGIYGNLQIIYERLEPIITWLYIFFLQTGIFLLIWVSFFFIKQKEKSGLRETQRELSAVALLFTLAVAFKLIFVTPFFFGPTIVGDEITYFDMAESIYRGYFSIKQTYHYPPLYPISFFFTMIFRNRIFEGIKLINVLLSSSSVFPIYLLSRQFLNHKESMIVASLSLLTPFHLLIPGHILSENLFFPLFLWVMLITFVIPKNNKSKIIWDLFNGLLIGSLYMTRYITLALIPAFLLAWWIKPFGKERGFFKIGKKKAIHFTVLILGIILVFSPWIYLANKEALPIKLALGFGVASKTTQEQLTLVNFLIYFSLYVFYVVLMSAPVFNLLLSSIFSFNLKKWRAGFQRFFFQVAVILLGYLAASARHSWRAYYNRDIPSKLMGRYFIVFTSLFLLLGSIALEKFQKTDYKNICVLLIKNQFIPLVIIIISYLSIFKGLIVPTEGSLIQPQGSADGFLLSVLGPFFWLILIVSYSVINLLLWLERKRIAKIILAISIAIYFIAASPTYFHSLQEYQTYPWIAKNVADLYYSGEMNSNDIEKITVFVPPGVTSKDLSELSNGLRIRGIKKRTFKEFLPENVENMHTEIGYSIEIINPQDYDAINSENSYEFNDEYFIIQEMRINN